MIFNKDTAEKTAELLLQINAIKLNPRNPFSWASGWNSPIYCDNRITLSFPAVRNYIRDEFSKNIEFEIDTQSTLITNKPLNLEEKSKKKRLQEQIKNLSTELFIISF